MTATLDHVQESIGQLRNDFKETNARQIELMEAVVKTQTEITLHMEKTDGINKSVDDLKGKVGQLEVDQAKTETRCNINSKIIWILVGLIVSIIVTSVSIFLKENSRNEPRKSSSSNEIEIREDSKKVR